MYNQSKMADGRHFEKNKKNRHISQKVRPIVTKFGTAAHIAPLNFTIPAHTLQLLFYLIKHKKFLKQNWL